jgi:hypothetical protein
MALCQRLAELGVYHSDGPGRPSLYHSYEEALVAKRHMARRAQQERRAKIKEARLRGEDSPIFTRGRKPLYTTKLEAMEAKRQQDKLASQRYKERLELALEELRQRLLENNI